MRVPLSAIIRKLESGVSVNGEERPKLPGEVGVLKVSSVTGGQFRSYENKVVSSASEQSRLAVQARQGDILMTRANGSRDLVGCSVLVRDCIENLYLSDKLWRIQLCEPTRDCPEWLFQVLNTTSVRQQVIDSASGSSGMRNISKEAFLAILVHRPTMDEQKSIVAVLSTWDRGIRQLTDLIAAKLRFKQGLMQQLLTGQRRFPGFTEEWQPRRLLDVTEEIRRRNDAGVTRVLTASGTHGLVDQQDYFNRSVAGKSLAGYFHLKRGEFAYNRSLMKGYPYGATKRLDDYEEGVVSTLYLCFRITSSECNSNWLTHVFEAGILNSQLRGIAKMGARAHGLLNVSASEFFNMVLSMPSPEEQVAIARVLDTADAEIALLEKELEVLKQQKKGLMQKLLTGQVRVTPSKGVA